jgi:hypothetical protein
MERLVGRNMDEANLLASLPRSATGDLDPPIIVTVAHTGRSETGDLLLTGHR